ncbi:hypothetical protein JCM6882_000244, partial [Rhodosporidiobolus microsporus]
GRVAVKLFPLISSETVKPELQILGPAMYGAAVVTGLLLWGLGIWFAFLAVVSITTQLSRARRNPGEGRLAVFNMGWWAFTFPLGSLTLLTFSLAETFDSMFFKVCSAIFTFSVLLLWIVVFLPTAIGFFRGTLFAAPCLQSLPKEYVEKMRGESRAPSRVPSRAPSPARRRGRAEERGGERVQEKAGEEREVEGTGGAMEREAGEVLRQQGGGEVLG